MYFLMKRGREREREINESYVKIKHICKINKYFLKQRENNELYISIYIHNGFIISIFEGERGGNE